jgi:type I pantothenate kinase
MTLPDNYTIHWQDMLTKLHASFARRHRGSAFVIGITGGVAAGKTTFAQMLREKLAAWTERPKVEIISTDGFLFPNKVLAEKNLSTRKGFPESYDVDALRRAIAALRRTANVSVPLYSHVTYDVDPSAFHEVSGADIVMLDGLHLGRLRLASDGTPLIDQLIYLDATEGDIETWFRSRLFPLMVEGRTDPNSFYYSFRTFDDVAAHEFVSRVWAGINLPNLREHIVRDRDVADIVVHKARDHAVEEVAYPA